MARLEKIIQLRPYHFMRHALLTALAVAMMPTQTSALSCERPDTVRAFKEASASDKTYFVLHGAFSFSESDSATGSAATSFDARFSGRLLTGAGFTQQVGFPLTVNATCAGDWCGKLEQGVKYVAFIENPGEQTFVLEVDACSSLAIRNPEPNAIKRLENCAQGGACKTLPVKR